MELVGLEPTTSWVRCGMPAPRAGARFRLRRAKPRVRSELRARRGCPRITGDCARFGHWCPFAATTRVTLWPENVAGVAATANVQWDGMRRAAALAVLAVAAMLTSSEPAAGSARSEVAPSNRSGVALKLFGRFRRPVYLTTAPRDRRRLFVVELGGRVRVVRHGRRLRRPFLDLRRQVRIERAYGGLDHGGLFSIAFPPDYSRSRRFYVFYTHRRGFLQVEEFQRSRTSRDRADPRSGRVVLAVPKASHFDLGGQIAFGPDRLLYIGLGQGPDPAAAQDLTTLRGKLLRISPTRTDAAPYRVPRTNPFVGLPGARPEIFASGLRNPWRFSFDRRSRTIAIGDVGERDVEEINFLPLARAVGANFGWDLFEGNKRRRPGTVQAYAPPALQYGHGRRACAVIGGRVVRSRSLRSLRGRYLYADLCSGRLRSVRVGRRGRLRGDRRERPRVSNPVAFGADARGRTYVVSFDGRIYRLVPR